MTDTAQGGPVYTRVEGGTVFYPSIKKSLDKIFPMTATPIIEPCSLKPEYGVAQNPHISPDFAGDPEDSTDPGRKLFTTHDGDMQDAVPFRAVDDPPELSSDEGKEDLPQDFSKEGCVLVDQVYVDEWTVRNTPPVHGEDVKPDTGGWPVERCSMGGSVSVH